MWIRMHGSEAGGVGYRSTVRVCSIALGRSAWRDAPRMQWCCR